MCHVLLVLLDISRFLTRPSLTVQTMNNSENDKELKQIMTYYMSIKLICRLQHEVVLNYNIKNC